MLIKEKVTIKERIRRKNTAAARNSEPSFELTKIIVGGKKYFGLDSISKSFFFFDFSSTHKTRCRTELFNVLEKSMIMTLTFPKAKRKRS